MMLTALISNALRRELAEGPSWPSSGWTSPPSTAGGCPPSISTATQP